MDNLVLDTLEFEDDPQDGGFHLRIKLPDGQNYRICKIYSSGEKQMFRWLQEKIAREGIDLASKIGP
jgi:hypothetical protein